MGRVVQRFVTWFKSIVDGEKKLVVCFIGFVIFFTVMAAWFGYFDKKETQREQFLQQASEVVQTERIVIKYVPKEVIGGVVEDTDVEIAEQPKKVTVKVNGKKHKFDMLETENQKFEKGKLVVEKENSISLDLRTPPEPKYKLGVEAVAGTDEVGAGVVVTHKFNNHAEADVYWHPIGDKAVGARVKFYL